MNSNNGYIKIYRSLTRHWIWQREDYRSWWLDMLMDANWEDKRVAYNKHYVDLKRGQMIASTSFLAAKWKVSRPTVIKYLNMLVNDNMVVRTLVDGSVPIITICNYERYQDIPEEPLTGNLTTTFTPPLTGGFTGDFTQTEEIKEIKENNILQLSLRANCMSTSAKIDAQEEPESQIFSEKTEKENQALEEIRIFFNKKILEHNSQFSKAREKFSDKRKSAILARISKYGVDQVKEVIDKATKSEFLNGGGRDGWVASLDWVMRPNNFTKVLDGNYDNRQPVVPKSEIGRILHSNKSKYDNMKI